MKKFLKTLAIYGFSTFIVLNLLAYLSLYSLEKSYFYKQQFVKNGITEKEFDYVILGSSTGLTTLDSKQIDSISGLTGFNISMDDSGLSAHYLMLQQFYSFGYQTKELVLCVMPEDLSNLNPVINGNDYRFLPHSSDENVKQYFREMDGKNKWIYQATPYVPIIGVSYFNTELFYPGVLATLKPKQRNLFDDRGNFSYPENQNSSKSLKQLTDKTKKVNIVNPYFIKIVDFCKRNTIQLTVYQSPVYGVTLDYDSNLNLINHASLFNEASLFYDKIHVNRKGRAICSREMGAYFLTQRQNK